MQAVLHVFLQKRLGPAIRLQYNYRRASPDSGQWTRSLQKYPEDHQGTHRGVFNTTDPQIYPRLVVRITTRLRLDYSTSPIFYFLSTWVYYAFLSKSRADQKIQYALSKHKKKLIEMRKKQHCTLSIHFLRALRQQGMLN